MTQELDSLDWSDVSKLQLRRGDKIVAAYLIGRFTMLVISDAGDGYFEATRVDLNGRYAALEGPIDVIPRPTPKVKKKGWVNIYSQLEDGSRITSTIYPNQEIASEKSYGARAACVPVEWEEDSPVVFPDFAPDKHVDPSIPPGEVHFKNDKGKTVGRITNIGSIKRKTVTLWRPTFRMLKETKIVIDQDWRPRGYWEAAREDPTYGTFGPLESREFEVGE